MIGGCSACEHERRSVSLENWVTKLNSKRIRTAKMYHTTGFTKDQIVELCALISAVKGEEMAIAWPPVLGLFNSVVVTLTYLRRNRVQAEIGEAFGVSQSTISRAVTALTDVLERVVADYVPVAEELDSRTQYIVDGTLLPCWSWRGQRQLYSGKHKTTGKNIQHATPTAGWRGSPTRSTAAATTPPPWLCPA